MFTGPRRAPTTIATYHLDINFYSFKHSFRCLLSRSTESAKNMQGNSRNLQRAGASKNAEIERSKDDLQHAERSQLHETSPHVFRTRRPKMRFWVPRWRPDDSRNHPSGAKMAPFSQRVAAQEPFWRRFASETPPEAFHINFGIDLAPPQASIFMFFHVLGARLWHLFCAALPGSYQAPALT